MGKWNWKAAISVILVAAQLSALLPFSGGEDITRFAGGGETARAHLAAKGSAVFTNLSLPVNSVPLSGSLNVSPLPVDGEYPLSPSLDVGSDGSAEWRFGGPAYGAFGNQRQFSDGSEKLELNFSSAGNASLQLLLPKGAGVQAAGMDIQGFAGQRWWNTSWRSRLPLCVTELAGRDQTEFPLEMLLDARNWTVASAEREFRVTRLNSTTLEETEVPLQVLDEISNGSKSFEAGLVFAVQNLSANSTQGYYLYFNNPDAAGRSALYRDFKPRLINNRLSSQTPESSFFGPVSFPFQGSFDEHGNYWVASSANHCVLGYTMVLGKPGEQGNDTSHFKSPSDVVVRPDGKIAVSDTGNFRVQVFNRDGTLAFTLGEPGVSGTDNAHFTSPVGLGTDPDSNIYVSDAGAHRIQVFDPNGSWLATIGTTGVPGTGPNNLNSPLGLFVNSSRDILVADSGNMRVQAFRYEAGPSWRYNYTIGVNGSAGSDNSHFASPSDVAIDPSGNTYVVDRINNRVQKFKRTQYLGTIGVTGTPGFDNAHLTVPSGVAVDSTGRVFVSDGVANRIQIFDSSQKYVQTLGSRHYANLVSPGSASGAFDAPGGVTADSSGRIFVSDSNNHRVEVFSALGDHVKTLGVTGTSGTDLSHFNSPRGLDLAPDGKLLVADGGTYYFAMVSSNHRVLIFNDLNDGTADGLIGITGVYGNDLTHLNMPWDVSVNKNSRAAVADMGLVQMAMPPAYYGQRVQVCKDLQDYIVDETYGIAGAPGLDSTHLSFPQGVGVSDAGWTYVADTANNRLALFKNDGDNRADLVLNPSGTAGTGATEFKLPGDVDVDSNGNVFVADTGNHRVQVFNQNGIYQYTLGETGVNLSDDFHLSSPSGIKLGGDDKIYVADSGNNRVMRITPANLTLGRLERLSIPENVGLDVGADGTLDWCMTGVLGGRAFAEIPASSIDRALLELPGGSDSYGNVMVTIPLRLSNAGAGRISISNLSIVYNCSLRVPDFAEAVGNYLDDHAGEADASGNVIVPISFSADSAGGILLGNLSLVADFAPYMVGPIPDFAIDEDTAAPSLCDLADYFRDDFDSILNFTMVCATNSSIADVRLVNGSVLSVDCTVPAARDWNGRIDVTARASDSRNLSTRSNTFQVLVRPVNDAPRIASTPPSLGQVGVEWRYDVVADDPDNENLTYSLERNPGNMTLDSASGRIIWTPAAGQEGLNEARVSASDGQLSDNQTFFVNVTEANVTPNHPPRILSTPVTVAEIGRRYIYAVFAQDEDNDRLEYSLDKKPPGMVIDSANGLIEWTPAESQIDAYEVTVRVSDSKISVTQSFTVTVTANASEVRPTIEIGEPAPNSTVGGTIWINGTASAKVGSVQLVQVRIDNGSWMNATGSTSWSYLLDTTTLSDGEHTIFVQVRDTAGNYAGHNTTVFVKNERPASPPPPSANFLGLELWALILLTILICAAVGAGVYVGVRGRRAATPASPAPPPAMAAAKAAPAFKPVDSAFLIYHDGRLITYYSRNESIKLDETLDMIRKFVKASFSGQLGRLDSMQYEKMNIIMERGNLMYMVVITPLKDFAELRREMRHLLDDVNNQYRVVFKVWDGDFSKVKGIKTMVEVFADEGKWEPVEEVPAGKPAAGSAEPRPQPPPGASPMEEDIGVKEPPKPSPAVEPAPPPAKQAPLKEASMAPDTDERPLAKAGGLHPLGGARLPPAEAGGLLVDERAPPIGGGHLPAQEAVPPPVEPSKAVPAEEEPASPPQAAPKPENASTPPPKPSAAAQLTDAERLQLLEDRFLRGEITELTYRELRERLAKR